MVSSNPTNLELKDLDNTFSIDVVKPFPTNSKYMSSASSSSYPGVVLMENTSPSGTSIKLLKDTINSPRTNSDKFNNKQQGSNPQSINPSENSNLRTISSNMLENNNSPNNVVKDDKERGKDATMQNTKLNLQKEELCISIQMNSENKPELVNDEHETYPASGKRKLEADDDVNENIKKKVHIETAGPSLFEDEEQDITSFIRILDDNEANIQYEEPEGQSNSIMIKIHSDVVDPQPEKQSASSPSKKLSLLNSQIKQSQSPVIIKSRVSKQLKEQQKSDLISPNKKEKQTTVQESDGGFDLFGFEDGLGIKILDEVFLCQYCQSQIPQDAGLKDICLKCQNKESKGFTLSEHRTILSETCMESESDFFSNSQPFPIKIINDRPHIKSFEFGTSLRPEQNIETQVGQETSDDEWVDILNHACFKDKLLCVGHKYQAEVTSLGLYDNKPRRDIRRLWNPSRVDLTTFEKFRTDVNSRNATYLIDEEVAEILVRNECDVQKALEFSIKANLEFQTYLKRSSNRRRLITKMSVR